MVELIKVTGEELVKKILDGERDFKGIELEENFNMTNHDGYRDLRKYMDISERRIDLKENPLNISKSRISGLKADGLKLPYLVAKDTILDSVSLKNGFFWNADFRDAVFAGVNATHSAMDNSKFKWAQFVKGGGGGMSLFEAASLKSCDFEKAEINNVTFGTAFLYGCRFLETKFSYVNLEYAVLDHAEFGGASFYEVHVEGASFMNADLRGINSLDWSHGLRKANFYKTKVTEKEKAIIDEAFKNVKRYVVEE